MLAEKRLTESGPNLEPGLKDEVRSYGTPKKKYLASEKGHSVPRKLTDFVR
jgi:hypothetical protein